MEGRRKVFESPDVVSYPLVEGMEHLNIVGDDVRRL
jgi:hypothetical protein